MGKTYPITVDYSKFLAEMIEAGEYDWVHPEITEKHFPIKKRKKTIEIELVYHNAGMRSDDILMDMDKRGLRPATLSELLAFGATYPDRQRDVPIVALGSVWRFARDYPYVAGIGHDGRGRVLDLGSRKINWRVSCRFAAVRK